MYGRKKIAQLRSAPRSELIVVEKFRKSISEKNARIYIQIPFITA